MTIMGILLIVSAALTVSVTLLREASREITALEAAFDLITFIRRNIESFLTPIDAITASWSYRDPAMKDFCDAVRSEGIKAAIRSELLPIQQEARRDLEAFAENIGKGYHDEEVKRCDYYLTRLEGYLSLKRERLDRIRPLYRYIPLIGAAGIIILAL